MMIVSLLSVAPVGVVKRITWLEAVLTFDEDIVSESPVSDAAKTNDGVSVTIVKSARSTTKKFFPASIASLISI